MLSFKPHLLTPARSATRMIKLSNRCRDAGGGPCREPREPHVLRRPRRRGFRAEVAAASRRVATHAVTIRAVALGPVLAVASAIAGPSLTLQMGVRLPGSDRLTAGPVLVLVGMVLVNGVLARCRLAPAFS